MITVERYSEKYKSLWDSFIIESKNQSFLFRRDFMDYHVDRFTDYSLMIWDEKKLVAVVPANLKDDQLISHQGLSYGGILLEKQIRLSETIDVVKCVLEYLNKHNIHIWEIKLIPRMYHTRPADELDWILFKLKAKLIRKDTALTIDNRTIHLSYQERRKRSIKKAARRNIQLKKGFEEIAPFWTEVLVPNLLSKHGVAPVHTLKEIELLASKFPENIQQHSIYLDGKIVAGCTMFLNNTVAHAQYISGTDIGRDIGCLDYLFDFLIKDEYVNYNYFDFGICNEQDGVLINKGLLDWKEGFGARTICHDFYQINTSEYNKLNNYVS
jgi:hypothetical protein